MKGYVSTILAKLKLEDRTQAALFAVQRLFIWEMPVMPQRLVWVRVIASLPLPFIAAATAMLLGRP